MWQQVQDDDNKVGNYDNQGDLGENRSDNDDNQDDSDDSYSDNDQWLLIWVCRQGGVCTGTTYIFFAFVFVEDLNKQNNLEKYNRRRMKDNLGERAVCGVGWHHWHWEDHVSQYLHRAGDPRDFDHRCDCDHHVCDHMVMILSQYLHLDGWSSWLWHCPF